MAYLTLSGSEEKNSGYSFISMNSTSNNGGLICSTTSLITNNTSLIISVADGGLDTCSFVSEPSESTIFAFGESYESSGAIAYSGSESCGSIAASSSSESCGSVASSVSSGSSFSGYCC